MVLVLYCWKPTVYSRSVLYDFMPNKQSSASRDARQGKYGMLTKYHRGHKFSKVQ